MKLFTLVLIMGSSFFFAGIANAQSGYARPPDGAWQNPTYVEPSDSTFRLSIGPALRIDSHRAHGGLVTALDIGARAAGARVSGAWARVGSEGGLSQYTAELWVDFGAERRLRPIVAAGAGLARLDEAGADGSLHTWTVGLGVLRGTLEYALPVTGADARVGVDVQAALPAIRGSAPAEVEGWLVAMARVGVGF
jgi:hypothetical protein